MTRMERPILIAAGMVCVALGAVGAVVPGMPTTIFLLGASYLFARSSPRLRQRLLGSRLAAPLRRYEETRRMPARAKAAAIGSMWTGITLAVWLLPASPAVVPAGIVALGVLGTGTILFLIPGERRGTLPCPASGSRAER
jgi:uncharacterized membrane protein YbaN (DUF454 family)